MQGSEDTQSLKIGENNDRQEMLREQQKRSTSSGERHTTHSARILLDIYFSRSRLKSTAGILICKASPSGVEMSHVAHNITKTGQLPTPYTKVGRFGHRPKLLLTPESGDHLSTPDRTSRSSHQVRSQKAPI